MPPSPRKPGSLLGLTEIAAMAGVSRQRMHVLSQRDDFPAPEAQVGGSNVWRAAPIEKWLRTYRHDPGGSDGAPP